MARVRNATLATAIVITVVSWSGHVAGGTMAGQANPARAGGARAADPLASVPADVAMPRTDQNSMKAHAQLLTKAKQGRIDAYFLGDSIVRRWGATDYPEFLAHWNATFRGWNAGNFGWGADRTQHILWRLEQGELDGVNPKVIVVLAGTNNVSPRAGVLGDADDIARGLRAIINLCRAKAPNAVVVVTGIFPRNDDMGALPIIRRINEQVRAMADGTHVRYLDMFDRLAAPDGQLFPGVLNERDKLHPTVLGYERWADALKPILNEILGPPAAIDLAPPPTGDPSVVGR